MDEEDPEGREQENKIIRTKREGRGDKRFFSSGRRGDWTSLFYYIP